MNVARAGLWIIAAVVLFTSLTPMALAQADTVADSRPAPGWTFPSASSPAKPAAPPIVRSTPPANPISWKEPPDAPDFNRSIYYRNKLEYSLEGGWLPTNIPFVFDRMIGKYDPLTPLHYTLVPFIASLRWHMNGIGGKWIFRGNWDATFSGTYTMIPRGPETRYFAFVTGIRRNFIQRNWRIVPYFEGRVGMGDINAKEPYGAPYAQGQDLTFTVMLGGGARYNINPRFAASAGVWYMHISNLYMSEPQWSNYGINVYGPMVGLTMTLGHHGEHPQVAARPTLPSGT